MKPTLSFDSPPASVRSDYQRIKSNLPRVVALLNAVFPGGGDYYARHLVLDDAKQTIRYTGDDATLPGNPVPIRTWIQPGHVGV